MTQPDSGALPPDLAVDEPPISDEVLAAIAIDGGEPARDGEPIQLGSWEEVEWAFRRLARSRGVLDRAASRYAEMVGRIDEWYEAETAAEKSTVAYLTGLIERYGVAHRTLDPKTATLRFPSGVIKTTERKEPRVVIADEAQAIAWVLGHLRDVAAEILHQQLTLRITELRNHVTIAETDDHTPIVVTHDGEVVEGITVDPPSITAKVTLITQEDDQ